MNALLFQESNPSLVTVGTYYILIHGPWHQFSKTRIYRNMLYVLPFEDGVQRKDVKFWSASILVMIFSPQEYVAVSVYSCLWQVALCMYSVPNNARLNPWLWTRGYIWLIQHEVLHGERELCTIALKWLNQNSNIFLENQRIEPHLHQDIR